MVNLTRVTLPYIITLLVGLAVGWWLTSNHWQAQHAEYVTNQQQASTTTIARLLERERNWAEQYREIQEDAETEAQRLADELATVERNNSGLRQTIDDLSRRHPDNPVAATECRSASRAARVSAELLGEAADLARVYAEEADRVRLVANSCHAAYGALREG